MMVENKVVLDSYNSGYSLRQNVSKFTLQSVIKWGKAAYGPMSGRNGSDI